VRHELPKHPPPASPPQPDDAHPHCDVYEVLPPTLRSTQRQPSKHHHHKTKPCTRGQDRPLTTGTTQLTVNSAAITGAGFTIVGGGFPVTLNPTQTLTLQLQFDPTTTGALTGQLTINSNSTTGSSAVVSLSGTGTAVAHEVDLSWDAPTSSPDPVAGYNIYRSTGSGSFVLINSSPDTAVAYVDNTVVSGTTYNYEVKSVDSSGVESVASNEVTATIP
jgi:hypothetical protein